MSRELAANRYRRGLPTHDLDEFNDLEWEDQLVKRISNNQAARKQRPLNYSATLEEYIRHYL